MTSTEPAIDDDQDYPVTPIPARQSSNGTQNNQPAERNRDPRRPAFYEQPDPRDVGNPSAHDLAAENLLDLDLRQVPKDLKADQKALRRILGRDLDDRAAFGLEEYGQTLQPGSGRDTLIDLVQEDLDALPYAEALLYEAKDSDEEAEVRIIVAAHRTAALYSRALLARRNGELPNRGTTPSSGGSTGTE